MDAASDAAASQVWEQDPPQHHVPARFIITAHRRLLNQRPDPSVRVPAKGDASDLLAPWLRNGPGLSGCMYLEVSPQQKIAAAVIKTQK